eukprot:11503606-Ditylum_brightwellii.AAC.1
MVLKELSTTKQFQCTQYIHLPQKVCHTFATASNSDNIFYGCRLSVCADGACMIHAKLVVGVGNNYCPKEHILDRPALAAFNMPPVGPERMLNSIPEADNLKNTKRTCRNHGNIMSVASGDNLVFTMS